MSTSGILTMARKELRSYFLSPVALIFLALFLVVVLVDFFYYSKFFARNLADVRPLFQSLPFLLVFLVAAVTMRQWSEEQKMGTLEVLLTLPVRTRDLVLGKFLAGMGLVALALALTAPLPITVSLLGQMDWGPVVGGYVAALLLASTYMAIGLCVSSRTDNQVVSLLVTAIICSILYALGSDTVTGFLGNRGAEVARALGSGSRFSSIERGVLDLRDLFYYASLTTFFLTVNGYFLEQKRLDRAEGVKNKRSAALVTLVAAAGANVLMGNLWLAPVSALRADLTRNGDYSVSSVTEDILENLAEPLTISGYFSEKTHPYLAPLVPQIRDFLEEYEIRGQGKVVVEYADPNQDPDLEEELNQQYGIKTFPFQITGRNEASVVNSYFHLLVKYGDEYQVLTFQDLIEVNASESNVELRLRNIEYDITRAIKKVSEGFQSIDAMFARATETARLTAYISADSLPKELAEAPDRVRKVAKEIAEKSSGKFVFDEKDPSKDQALAQELNQKYGLRPMATDLFAKQSFYFYLIFQSGQRIEPVVVQGESSEADVKSAIEAAIKRATPGFLKTVGLLTEEPKQEPPNPMMPPEMQPPRKQGDFRQVQRQLSEDLTVKRIDGKSGTIPQDIDVLIVAKPGKLDEKQQFAIDQYLMRGGALIVLSGSHAISPDPDGLKAVKQDEALKTLLTAYGVDLGEGFVMDEQNARFPIPVRERRGGFMLERIDLQPYPFFPDLRADQFKEGHVALAGLPGVVLTWASPVTLKDGLKPEEVKAEVLITSTDKAWVRKEADIEPRPDQPGLGFAHKDEPLAKVSMAVTLVGRLPSAFKEKASPLFGGENPGEGADRTGRTLKESTPDARLAVVGSSEFAGDIITGMAMQVGQGEFRGNLQFVRNLIDWSMEDTDLLKIRSAGAYSRTLKPMDDGEKTRVEVLNYLAVAGLLAAAVVSLSTRRRRARPIFTVA
ncbi:MAG: Gldg family protein [Bradymonadia bacterium]|jgi:ABC-2 type transport system permease protein